MTILKYVLIPLVGRRVERGCMPKSSPPFIYAALVVGEHLQQLQVDTKLRDFCCRRWRSPTLLDDLLRLIRAPLELKSMSKQQKLTAVYQCSLAAEFRDMTHERENQQAWLAMSCHTRVAGPADAPLAWKLCVAYLKAKLEPGYVFSMCVIMFQAAGQPLLASAAKADPVSDVVSATRGASIPPAFDATWGSSVAFFEVLNVHPERRAHVRLHHLDYDTDVIHVARRTLMRADDESQRVVVLHKADSQVSLHLRTLVNNLSEVLPSLWQWQQRKHGSAQAFRLPDGEDTFLPALESVSMPVADNVLELPVSSLGGEHCPAAGTTELAVHLPTSMPLL